MDKRPNPLNPENWQRLPHSIQIIIAWRVFRSAHWPQLQAKALKALYRMDLWLFPPVMFTLVDWNMKRLVPADHPMAFYAIMATSFMAATLTLFLLRPPKHAHWI